MGSAILTDINQSFNHTFQKNNECFQQIKKKWNYLIILISITFTMVIQDKRHQQAVCKWPNKKWKKTNKKQNKSLQKYK